MPQNKESLLRLNSVDILKGIGIILVLLGHLPTGNHIHMLIYSFHMPLFFFCSGMFFKSKPIYKSLIKDCKSILIPYFFFDCILILTIVIISILHHHNFSCIYSITLNPLDSMCYPLYHNLWFLICLFIIRQMFNLISSERLLHTGFLTGGGYFAAQLLQNYGIKLPFFIDSALGLMYFFAMGYFFKQFQLVRVKTNVLLSVFVLIFYLIVMDYVKPTVNTRDNIYPCYLFVSAVIPIISLFYISEWLSTKNNFVIDLLKSCGISSLFIFALHGPIFEIAFPIMSKLDCPNYFVTILLLMISIPICKYMECFVNKHMPWIIGKF